MYTSCIINDDLCIINDGLCIKNDELCIKNDGFNANVQEIAMEGWLLRAEIGEMEAQLCQVCMKNEK